MRNLSLCSQLIVAKTKPAMVNLTRQFAERKVKKTYTAIVNGIPSEDTETRITSLDAYKLGVDVDPNDENSWQVIDQTLDEKHAITVWRSVRHVKSLKARDGVLTMVELKPKTGRYHQLRRHMAWDRDSPLVGDKTYDDGTMVVELYLKTMMALSESQHPLSSHQSLKAFYHMKKPGH